MECVRSLHDTLGSGLPGASLPARGNALLAILLAATLPLSSGCSDVDTDRQPWPVSPPEAQGLDGVALHRLVERIERGDYGSIHSLLVVRRDHLVLEAYFRGYDRGGLHAQFSVTKSVASALVGIALARGMIDSVGVPLMRFFPDDKAGYWHDERKRAITLEHVLTMTAGFAWDELAAPYGDPRNPVMRLHASEDWPAFVLSLAVVDPPGSHFVYNSGASMLLAVVLRQATGLEVSRFAREVLFEPLGIHEVDWTSGPGGITNTAWGLSLRPVDMAKIGALMLRSGRWNQRQILPERWVHEALRPRVPGPEPYWYGYQWWMMPMELPGHVPSAGDIVFARGWGGQFIILVPTLDLIVVSTGGNYRGRDDQALDFLQHVIVNAVTDPTIH
jgi:CubicO group peptidase (beta-lactamase class C family)